MCKQRKSGDARRFSSTIRPLCKACFFNKIRYISYMPPFRAQNFTFYYSNKKKTGHTRAPQSNIYKEKCVSFFFYELLYKIVSFFQHQHAHARVLL